METDTSPNNGSTSTCQSSFSEDLPSKVDGIAICSALAVEAVLIIAGNLLTIILFVLNKTLRKKSLYLVVNMAVVDLILGAVILPVLILEVGSVYHVWEGTVHSSFFTFLGIADSFFLQGSLLSASMISIERLYAIYWPLKHRSLSSRSYRNVVFIVWASSIIVSTIFTVLSLLTTAKHAIYTLVSYFIFLLLIVCGCNIGIWRKFQQGPFASQQQNRASQNYRLTKTLLLVSCLALLSWLPLLIVNYLRFKCLIKSPTIFFVAVVATFSNSFVNPIVYALRMPELRRALDLSCFNRYPSIDMKENERKNRNAALVSEIQLRTLSTDPVNIRSSASTIL